jgi:Ca-activated chloride channel homolog
MNAAIVFKNPEYLYLFIGLIPMIGWYIWKQRSMYPAYTVSDTKVFGAIKSGIRPWLRHIPFVLRLGVFSCIIVALCRPQTFDSWKDSSMQGIDIVIASDVSVSMLATDFTPNRLEVAKKVALEFIDKRPFDRLGLVIFAGESFTQCPLTTDHKNIKELMGKMEPRMLKDGTAIGMGLATAVNRLRKSDATSKVVILLTDGVNNQGTISPKTAAELAQAEGIKVYTIGVGSDQPTVMTPYGEIKAEIDEPMMKEIAKLTGGKYFRAKDNKALTHIYDEIDQLEKTEIDVTEYKNSKEEFHILLYAAGILLLLEIILRNTVLAVLA